MENKLKSLYKTAKEKFLYLAAPIVFTALTSCAMNKFYVEDDLYYIPEKKIFAQEQNIQNEDTLFFSEEDVKNFSDLEFYTSTNKSALNYWSWRFEHSPYRSSLGRDSDKDGIIDFDDPWKYRYGPFVDSNGNGIIDITDWQISGIGNPWLDNYWLYSNYWHQRSNYFYSYRYHLDFPYYSHYPNFFNFPLNNSPNSTNNLNEKSKKLENVVRRDRPSTLTNTLIPSETRRNPEMKERENSRRTYTSSYIAPRINVRPPYNNSNTRRTMPSNQNINNREPIRTSNQNQRIRIPSHSQNYTIPSNSRTNGSGTNSFSSTRRSENTSNFSNSNFSNSNSNVSRSSSSGSSSGSSSNSSRSSSSGSSSGRR